MSPGATILGKILVPETRVKGEITRFEQFIGPENGLVVLLPCEKVIAFHLTAVSERGNSMKMKASSDILAT
jgi:hypothetical protein